MNKTFSDRRAKFLRSTGATIAVLLATSVGIQAFGVEAADATPTARVMVNTQRMSAATLNSTQSGWYTAGSTIALSCYSRGESVKGYYSPYIPGGWDNLWYQVSDGYWVADVDINTGSDNPITPACGSVAPSSVAIDTNTWFTLTARNSGKVIDVRGGSSANGTALQQYSGNGTAAQKFRFVDTGSGYYAVVSALSSTQVWDVSGGGSGNGTKVQVWGWASGLNQQWLPVSAGSGYITFKPRHVTSRCLDVPGGSTANSVQLQIYDCNGTSSQQFAMTAVGTVADLRASHAVSWANSMVGSNGYYNACGVFVAQAYGAGGIGYTTALKFYNALHAAGSIHTSAASTAPLGALVFSSSSSDGGSGHVDIARGDGTFVSGGVSTTYRSTLGGAGTTVQILPATNVTKGYTYLGWAYAPASWPGR